MLEPGYKYNLPDMAAVLGLRQLARLEEFIAKRTALAMRYREKFAGMDEVLPLADPPHAMRHAWHLFIVRLDTEKAGMTRAEFMHSSKHEHRHGAPFPGRPSPKTLRRVDGFPPRDAAQHGVELGPHLLTAALPGYDLRGPTTTW